MVAILIMEMHFTRGVGLDLPWALWIAQHHGVCVVLSYAILAFEALFITAVVCRRVVPLWLSMGLVFHLALFLTRGGNPGFLAWPLLYLTFVEFEGVRVRPDAGPVDAPPAGPAMAGSTGTGS